MHRRPTTAVGELTVSWLQHRKSKPNVLFRCNEFNARPGNRKFAGWSEDIFAATLPKSACHASDCFLLLFASGQRSISVPRACSKEYLAVAVMFRSLKDSPGSMAKMSAKEMSRVAF